MPSCAACTIGVDKVPSALGSGSDPNLCAANPEPSTLLVGAVREDQVAGAVASGLDPSPCAANPSPPATAEVAAASNGDNQATQKDPETT